MTFLLEGNYSHLLKLKRLSLMAVQMLTKKPVNVEGIRFTGDNHDECAAFCGDRWHCGEAGTPFIKTIEGDMLVKEGAMVVKGIRGEYYAVDPAIVEETFSRADGSAVESFAVSSLEAMTQKERDEAPDSFWGMPRLKKIKLGTVAQIRLGWDMIDRVKGATDEDRAQARHRVLAAAKHRGIDTSDWNKGKKSLENYLQGYQQKLDKNFVMDCIPYLLNQLSEEASEFAVAACRAQRFGIDSVDPNRNISNRDKLREEYADVLVMSKLIEEELYARGYDPLLLDSSGPYFQERLASRIASLKKEYAEGRFTLPGEFADQQQ